jgi:hypothetical protein
MSASIGWPLAYDFGGKAEMAGATQNVANDPTATLADQICCRAQQLSLNEYDKMLTSV